ncbi:hypothetical protein PV783_24675 [Chitinophaga sp. CC14]|uniref:hypothetical protein n=1 Tax=Chitinophaga sp. CC14 TaxID=3029199 RepID=UPI003B766FCB
MKKLQQAAAAAPATSEQNAKSTLTVVTASDAQRTTGVESQTETHKSGTVIPFEKRKEAIETLHQKVQTLANLKAKYEEYCEFEFDLKEGADIDSEVFATCSITIVDSKGRKITAKSGPYIFECHESLKAKYKAAIDKLENEINWPYPLAA